MSERRRFTPAELKRLRDAREAGVKMKDLAKRFQCGKDTIRIRLAEYTAKSH